MRYTEQSNINLYTVEPVYYGHFGTNEKDPDYQGVLIFQVSTYVKAPFGTITNELRMCPYFQVS